VEAVSDPRVRTSIATLGLVSLALLAAGCWLVVAAQAAPPVRSAPPVPGRTLLPVDEAAALPDFFSFRARLLQVVARRDAAALLEIVDPDIKNGFGGDDGKDAFEREWRPSSGDSKVWETLAAVLALGGRRSGEDGFTAPYVFAAWPDGVDGFEHVAVIGDRVRIRRAARDDAAEIGVVSFAVLKRGRDDQAPEAWTPVIATNGQAGYISSQYVRSPIDYRAFFTKKGGRWRMVMLLAGD
jgi:hypothetical protein